MSDCSFEPRRRAPLSVEVGRVSALPSARADKAQALKVVEEAAEVFGAWQAYERRTRFDEGTGIENSPQAAALRDGLLDEIADCVTACAGMAAALGVRDLTGRMRACDKRNRDRGRM